MRTYRLEKSPYGPTGWFVWLGDKCLLSGSLEQCQAFLERKRRTSRRGIKVI